MHPVRQRTKSIRTRYLQWTGAAILCLAIIFTLPTGPLNAQEKKSLSALERAEQERYIDTRTGHLYAKRADGNYDEFTRKGRYFKRVLADLPLLLRGKSVYPVSNGCYFLYSKKRHRPDSQFKLLPVQAPHPKGWALETALGDLDYLKKNVDKVQLVVHDYEQANLAAGKNF